MGKIRTWARGLSLRGSLVLHVIVFTMIALGLCYGTEGVCSHAREAIYDALPPWGEKYYLTNEKGERLGEGGYIGTAPRVISEKDERLLRVLAVLPMVADPVYSGLCILAAAFVFYRNRLREPLGELKRASEKIAANDLDFSLQYGRADELGDLCASFETMRAALRDSFSKMWRQMEERGRLNAAFAHDLRTPLTVLRGCDELLQGKEDAEVRTIAAAMGRHIDRMERYVESMGQLRRLEDRQPEYRAALLEDLFGGLSESADMICRENGKILCLEDRTASKRLCLDGAFLSEVSANLVANAVRYASKRVTLVLEEQEAGVALRVADDGPGFGEEVLHQALEPYVTGEEKRGEHFGLGLYICKVLCESHGGWLKVENGKPQGAKVTAFFQNGSKSR